MAARATKTFGQSTAHNSPMRDCIIIGGSSHPELVEQICRTLDVEPAPSESRIFSNGETGINIHESVRDKNVFVVQTSCGNVNDYLMESLILVSAVKIASAKSVTCVSPFFPYSRQLDAPSAIKKAVNKRDVQQELKSSSEIPHPAHLSSRASSATSLLAPTTAVESDAGSPRRASTFGEETRVRNNGSAREKSDARRKNSHPYFAERAKSPFSESYTKPAELESSSTEINTGMRSWVAQSGSLVASLSATAGADHVITMDSHDPQYQGFFDVPFDNSSFRPSLIEYIQAVIPTYHAAVIVSPDAGGAKRATQVADQSHTRFASIHQDRRNNATILVGDVNDRVAILIDDLVDTGKTMIRAARILKDHGAVKVFAICTHGSFSDDTVYKIRDSAIDRVVTTNSIPQAKHREISGDKLDVVDISSSFAEAIRRVYNGESISRSYHQVPIAI